MYTALCCRYLAQKGYPLTLVTPGNHKAKIFRVVEALGAHFDQVVLAGYPPFLKEVVDSGIAQGVHQELPRLNSEFANYVPTRSLTRGSNSGDPGN